jgi:hypothetical protein
MGTRAPINISPLGSAKTYLLSGDVLLTLTRSWRRRPAGATCHVVMRRSAHGFQWLTTATSRRQRRSRGPDARLAGDSAEPVPTRCAGGCRLAYQAGREIAAGAATPTAIVLDPLGEERR